MAFQIIPPQGIFPGFLFISSFLTVTMLLRWADHSCTIDKLNFPSAGCRVTVCPPKISRCLRAVGTGFKYLRICSFSWAVVMDEDWIICGVMLRSTAFTIRICHLRRLPISATKVGGDPLKLAQLPAPHRRWADRHTPRHTIHRFHEKEAGGRILTTKQYEITTIGHRYLRGVLPLSQTISLDAV